MVVRGRWLWPVSFSAAVEVERGRGGGEWVPPGAVARRSSIFSDGLTGGLVGADSTAEREHSTTTAGTRQGESAEKTTERLPRRRLSSMLGGEPGSTWTIRCCRRLPSVSERYL